MILFVGEVHPIYLERRVLYALCSYHCSTFGENINYIFYEQTHSYKVAKPNVNHMSSASAFVVTYTYVTIKYKMFLSHMNEL